MGGFSEQVTFKSVEKVFVYAILIAFVLVGLIDLRFALSNCVSCKICEEKCYLGIVSYEYQWILLSGSLFLPLSLDELSRGVATVIYHFDRSGSVTVGSRQIKEIY